MSAQLIPAEMKRCNRCQLVKDRTEFYPQPYGDGHSSKCKKCQVERARELVAQQRSRAEARNQPTVGGVPFGSRKAVEASQPGLYTDEDFLIKGLGTEPERRAALAAILAKRAAKAGWSKAQEAPDEIKTRLELATAILDRVGNGSVQQMPEAIGQAHQFVLIERGTCRYIRKLKT